MLQCAIGKVEDWDVRLYLIQSDTKGLTSIVRGILRGGAILWDGLECKGQGPGLLSLWAEEDGYPSLEMLYTSGS